jgi:hypothetical protein
MPQTKKHERNKAVREAFNKIDSKVYTLDHRLDKVAQKFFLQPNTVYRIVMKLEPYKD